jgi:hypothetical protein
MRTRSRHQISRTGRARRRGGAIVLSLAFVFIVAISVAALLQFSSAQRRITRSQLEREAVYYSAEAGVDQVIHYFNTPDDWTSDTSLFAKDATTGSYFDSSGNNVFEARLSSGPLTLIDSGTNEDLIVFTSTPINNSERSRVAELTIDLPPVGAPPFTILAVNSRSTNSRGVEREVQAFLKAVPPFPLVVPAALISHAATGGDGQLNVNWGGAWSQGNMDISNLNNITTTADSEAIYYIGGQITKGTKYATGYGGGDGFSSTPLVPAESNYFQPWLGYNADHENLFQHHDFTSLFASYGLSGWSDLTLDYDMWKTLALDRGMFFSTDASGNVYQGTVESAETLLSSSDFYDLIDQSGGVVVGSDLSTQVLPEPNIIFIDTIDGQPPNGIPVGTAGSNLCDVSFSGGSVFTRGVMYVAGNISYGGAGSATQVWVEKPDLTEALISVNHYGVLYTDGQYDQSGTRYVFGSIMAKGGFTSGGGPDVYYDHKLADGQSFNFNSEVSVVFWQEIPVDAF